MDIIWTVLTSLHFESTTFFCQVALFFILHYSLKFLIYTPIMEIRDRREKRIASNLAAAEAATAEARRLKEDYEERVRGARAEGQAALATATAEAEAERKARVERAREQASKILEEAKAAAVAAREQAEATIEAQSEQVAKAIASRLVVASLGEAEAKPVLAKIGGGKS
jgi:F-type H+-transporting ATPase subunit b